MRWFMSELEQKILKNRPLDSSRFSFSCLLILLTILVTIIGILTPIDILDKLCIYFIKETFFSKNGNGYSCEAFSPFDNKKFQYTITPKGLIDES